MPNDHEATRVAGMFLRDVIACNRTIFAAVGPDEAASNRLDAVFEVTVASVGTGSPFDEHIAWDDA